MWWCDSGTRCEEYISCSVWRYVCIHRSTYMFIITYLIHICIFITLITNVLIESIYFQHYSTTINTITTL